MPALVSGRRTVVATATKALQDQLADKDLPFLAEHLDRPFTHAVLKGRSNYLCLQRLREVDDEQLSLDVGPRPPAEELAALAAWAAAPRPATGPSSSASPPPGRGRRSA